MAFDIKKFRNLKTQPRIKEVTISQLQVLFDEDEKPVFKVRNLTGHELALCNEAVKANTQIRALVEKLLSESAKEKAQAICESLGVNSDKTPDDLVRRIQLLRLGVIEPELTHEDCVRFASMFPEPFYDLTNQVLQLTHLGADLGEYKDSGMIKE